MGDAKSRPGIHITTVRVGHFGKKSGIYVLEKSSKMMRNFGPKNVIHTVEGPDTLRKMSSFPMEGEKSWPKASTLLEVLRNHL